MNKFYDKAKWVAVFLIIWLVAFGLLFAATALIISETARALGCILIFVALLVWAYDTDILFERVLGIHDER